MKENVVIIGGGVAGMEAAKQLLFLGYTPIVVEQKDHLGGHVSQWNRLFPDMASAQDLVRHLGEEIVDANIFLETKVNFINRLREGYLVMLSNGVSVACRAILVASGFRLFDAARKEEYACMTMSSRTPTWKTGSTGIPIPVFLPPRRRWASSTAWAPAT